MCQAILRSKVFFSLFYFRLPNSKPPVRVDAPCYGVILILQPTLIIMNFYILESIAVRCCVATETAAKFKI